MKGLDTFGISVYICQITRRVPVAHTDEAPLSNLHMLRGPLNLLPKTHKTRRSYLGNVLLFIFFLSPLTWAFEIEQLPIKPNSNAKVTLLEDPTTGLLSTSVELYWTFSPGKNDGTPKELVLFFQLPDEVSFKTTPQITSCFTNNTPIPDPEWNPEKGFVLPLVSPLFPGTKLHIEFLFSCELEQPIQQGLLNHFFPKIPSWHKGQWVISPDFQVVYPYGTYHILTHNPQFQVIIPPLYQRQAAQNTPPIVNGCSIGFSSEIPHTMDWNGSRIDFPPTWSEIEIRQSLDAATQRIPVQLSRYLLILKGKTQAGWGICCAESPQELTGVIFEMLMMMNYPVLQARQSHVYSDLQPFLMKPEEFGIGNPFMRFFTPPFSKGDHSPLSCFMNQMGKTRLASKLDDWLSNRLGQLTALEDVFDLETLAPEEHIEISQMQGTEQGYNYRFNVAALLAPNLFLLDSNGNYRTKKGRTRVTESFPAPLIGWQTGLSYPQMGTIKSGKENSDQEKRIKIHREHLWKSIQLQWLL